MELLFNHVDICNYLYMGHFTQAINLFDKKFESISSEYTLSDCKLFLSSLNHAIYNYILIKENTSLYQCCHMNSQRIQECFDYTLLYEIGLEIIRNYNYCELYLIEKYEHPEIKKAIYYIHEHIHTSLTLEQVCVHIGLNRCYFCTLFKKETGYPFSSYIRDTKMRLALKLMRETQLSLSTIAEQCGFNSYSYFCSTFKQVYGLSPTQFKQTIKKP